MGDSYTEDDIEVLDSVTGIRRRPQMYAGDTTDPTSLGLLIRESLCLALKNALCGCSSEIKLTVNSTGCIEVWDNGPPPEAFASDPGFIQSLFTQIYACRDLNQQSREQLCMLGIVLTNALSESLTYECGYLGNHWRQDFRQGRPVGPIAIIGTAESQWQQISFCVDRSIFGETALDLQPVIDYLREQQIDSTRCKITVEDKRVGLIVDL